MTQELLEIVRQLRVELAWAREAGWRNFPAAPEQKKTSRDLTGESFEAPVQDAAELPAVVSMQLADNADLSTIRAHIGDCTRCKLSGLGRKNIVFGVGNPDAEVMFVGEGPGADEDIQGEPFVGKAGQLLTRIIEGGMGVKREDVYIANIVKCRPPQNRDPEDDEISECEPFLRAQIRAVRPKVLVALGRCAAQTLLRDKTPISRLRGQWREYEGIPLMPTYHPAYLLRNPAEKRPVWEDIQAVLKKLGRSTPSENDV
jgi:uracil-DNA glycosylase